MEAQKNLVTTCSWAFHTTCNPLNGHVQATPVVNGLTSPVQVVTKSHEPPSTVQAPASHLDASPHAKMVVESATKLFRATSRMRPSSKDLVHTLWFWIFLSLDLFGIGSFWHWSLWVWTFFKSAATAHPCFTSWSLALERDAPEVKSALLPILETLRWLQKNLTTTDIQSHCNEPYSRNSRLSPTPEMHKPIFCAQQKHYLLECHYTGAICRGAHSFLPKFCLKYDRKAISQARRLRPGLLFCLLGHSGASQTKELHGPLSVLSSLGKGTNHFPLIVKPPSPQ